VAAPEEAPTTLVRALRPPAEPSTIVLVIAGRITRADIPGLCESTKAWLGASDGDLVVCDVAALVDPDAAAVDALARLQLTAHRFGRRVKLRHASRDLQDLLDLMGLRDVVPLGES
jgi:ABC-type transporter Mla MlaB component